MKRKLPRPKGTEENNPGLIGDTEMNPDKPVSKASNGGFRGVQGKREESGFCRWADAD
jgi:hypothetical protein